jgi:asparagine synthase (glutamine-hydrolysing)
MSAIAGRLRFDGGPVREAELVRAANALTQYGPDRSDVAVAGPFGLVHVLARFTPEDRFDRQPCRGDSGALIVADLRLDNRGDLIALLGMTPAEAASWSDSRLLLALWETLGDCVWPLLRGPFAVAIAEPRERSLTLARDHLGLRTVMWHRGAHAFSFATMPNGLFAFVDVPRQLSEEKFADFLVLNHADHATTIYRNVFRVPPAHVMRVTAGGAITQRRYWSAGEIMPFTLSSDQDYADGLRDCLDRAVRRQLRSVSPVGCLLSGGLDSSAVAALAARALAEKNQRLAGFTGVPRPEFRGAAPAGCPKI